MQASLIQALARIGAIQFGQFETRPGVFAPVAIRLALLPSYPAILRDLAGEIVPLVKIARLTHLLTKPAATPIGVAVSLAADMPLVYPAPGDPQTIEGAYDFNVPTVLLTDVFTDGATEQALAGRVKGLGLDVKAVVTVLDLRIQPGAVGNLPVTAWSRLADILPDIGTLTPSMRATVRDWLASITPLA
jgi:orotate phosphoribosyltransferase